MGMDLNSRDVKCEQCGQAIRVPTGWLVYIDGKYQFSITVPHETRNQRRLVRLCAETCAMRFAWRSYCLRRLRGKMKGAEK